MKADQCAQYVDDIGIAANDADQLIKNLRATFECIRETGTKLTMHKCHFGASELDFLGRNISREVIGPQKERIINFLVVPKIQEDLPTLSWFSQLLRNFSIT